MFELAISDCTRSADRVCLRPCCAQTPDEANRNPESGGLVVYRRRESAFRTSEHYNSYEIGEAELGLSTSDVLQRVGYRQNRAVLFSSSLYHATDTVEFHPGFENCRINYTLLFGFMEAVRCKRDASGDVSAASREASAQVEQVQEDAPSSASSTQSQAHSSCANNAVTASSTYDE